MTVYVTPRTWTNAVVTAADLNVEIRDRHNWFKGALDLLTNGSASDVGTATYLQITRPVGTDNAHVAKVTGDANPRLTIAANGRISWGGGVAGTDVSIERLGLDRLGVLGGTFEVARGTDISDGFKTSVVGESGFRFKMQARGYMSWAGSDGVYDTAMGRIVPGVLSMGANTNFQLVDSSIYFGPNGAYTSRLYESTPGRISSPNQISANDGLVTKVQNLKVVDGSFVVPPPNGMIALDNLNKRITVRMGNQMFYAALTLQP